MTNRAKIRLEGIVQGVGFRPFIHRLSAEFGLNGRVKNTSFGVEIEIEGENKKLTEFYYSLRKNVPALAKITDASIKFLPPKGYKDFLIQESKKNRSQSTLISPDISICNDCVKELLAPEDRRYLYPFINCTNCGPRFSIIKDLPYGRHFTTMRKFKLCFDCKFEFENIGDRRYHAEPNACKICGPVIELWNNQGKKILQGAFAIDKAVELLKLGAIIAIKGIGGFHIACDAQNTAAIKKLRKLKKRPAKPLAIMAKNIEEIHKICEVSNLEAGILNSPERPIVLLKKKKDSGITGLLAPENNYLGVMLAFTPLHYLLFFSPHAIKQKVTKLVMTSGNIADEPLEWDNHEAISNLKNICGYFLVHNRDIYNRIDDSIVQVINNTPVIIRRGRGYAPLPFITDKNFKNILACGGELKNTFCLTKGKFAFLSQYIGDLKTYKTFEFYKEAIGRFTKLFAVKPQIIASDLHPDYFSTKYAQESALKQNSLKWIKVQHHHAHVAGVIAEHRITEEVIGICFDGAGYGLDGQIWGGEIFTGGLKKLTRKAHLKYVPLAGMDKATEEPYRMAISYLYQIYGEDIYKLKIDLMKRHKANVRNIVTSIKTASPLLTSSAGRLFDSVSALLGICDIITYEAEAAIELQMLAEKSKTKEYYIFKIEEQDNLFIIDARNALRGIIGDIEKKISKETIARKFHNGLAKITLDTCGLLREESKINTVVLSGGVFQNKLFSESLIPSLEAARFKVYYHQLVPNNDGSISLGQAAIANEQI